MTIPHTAIEAGVKALAQSRIHADAGAVGVILRAAGPHLGGWYADYANHKDKLLAAEIGRCNDAEAERDALAAQVKQYEAMLAPETLVNAMRSLEISAKAGLEAIQGKAQAEFERDALAARVKELEEALAKIRDEDWVENCLDLQNAARIARAALQQEDKPHAE